MSKKGSNPEVESHADNVTGPLDGAEALRDAATVVAGFMGDLVTVSQNFKDTSANLLATSQVALQIVQRIKVG